MLAAPARPVGFRRGLPKSPLRGQHDPLGSSGADARRNNRTVLDLLVSNGDATEAGWELSLNGTTPGRHQGKTAARRNLVPGAVMRSGDGHHQREARSGGAGRHRACRRYVRRVRDAELTRIPIGVGCQSAEGRSAANLAGRPGGSDRLRATRFVGVAAAALAEAERTALRRDVPDRGVTACAAPWPYSA
jgi:hypothetical protein